MWRFKVAVRQLVELYILRSCSLPSRKVYLHVHLCRQCVIVCMSCSFLSSFGPAEAHNSTSSAPASSRSQTSVPRSPRESAAALAAAGAGSRTGAPCHAAPALPAARTSHPAAPAPWLLFNGTSETLSTLPIPPSPTPFRVTLTPADTPSASQSS